MLFSAAIYHAIRQVLKVKFWLDRENVTYDQITTFLRFWFFIDKNYSPTKYFLFALNLSFME